MKKQDVPSRPTTQLDGQYHNGNNNFSDNTESYNTSNEKEWSFKFDVRFDMRSKIKTPTAPTNKNGQDKDGEGNNNNNEGGIGHVVRNLLSLLWR